MFTCISCQVAFVSPENQREHFQSDWHRYNLKRKVAELPPVSAETFQERVLAHKSKAEEDESRLASTYCEYCKRVFGTKNSFENHVKSKKHNEQMLLKKDRKIELNNKKNLPVSKNEEEMEVEEVDSDEWEGDPIPVTSCLFCSKEFTSLEENMKHMTRDHSFFVPDLQYCVDLSELISYLGEKVGCGMICLWCNERSKHFGTVVGTQRHMRDKGHCMMKFEGETVIEYSDFYDYSSSYPDADSPNVNPNEEYEPEKLISDGYELTLPSGVTVGHRSLLRYYRQRLKSNSQAIAVRKSSGSVYSKIMADYRALGWKEATKADIAKRARDIQFMHRIQAKHRMQIGVKANKLQKHFRPQVLF